MYAVELLTRDDKRKVVRAFGVDKIGSEIAYVELENVRHDFSEEIQSQWAKVQDRPTGGIHILIGSEMANIHPWPLEVRDNLVML